MANPLPPMPRDPIGENHKWREWLNIVRNSIVGVAGSVPITHNSLSSIDGGTSTERYHLTQAQQTGLTGGAITALHEHDFETVNWPTTLQIGSPTHITKLQDTINHMWSAGLVDGGALTDNGDGTVTIAAGTAVLHATTDPHTDIYECAVAQQILTPTDNSTNYIAVDYNSGSPQYSVSTSITSFNCIDKCIIYVLYRAGTALHWIDVREQNVDGNRKTRRMFLDFSRFIHAENGTVLGSSGLAITVTAGSFYFMLQQLTHDAFDTSVAGTANVNVFHLWYRDGVGGWTETANQKTVTTTTYDDNSGTPATLNNNKFGVTWFYIVNDAPSELHAVMGQSEYANLAAAEVASPPDTVPGIISGLGSLIGYVIYEKSNTVFDDVRSAFTQRFTSSSPTTHSGLADLAWTSSGHTGTASKLAGFDGTGAASEYTLGTGVATALAINVGSAGAPVVFNGALGTPSSGTVTNLTGTASININGTVGATTRSSGAFTNIGVGIAHTTNHGVRNNATLTGATTQFGYSFSGTFDSSCTVAGYANYSFPATQDAAYTLPSIIGYGAVGFTKGAASTVTNYFGFYAFNETEAATGHYGFYGAMTAGTGKWNFYASGTALNYMNGALLIGSATDDTVNKLQVTGSIKATTGITSIGATAGIGYGTGAGGTVTQETSRTTGVTINKVTGAITLVSAAGSTTWQSFTVTNSSVAATDTIIVNQKSGTDQYMIHVTAVAAGSFVVTFATTGGTTTEQPVFNFAVIKGVTA